MKYVIHLTLKKVARGSGGDRYEGTFSKKNVVLYFPQVISRPDGLPVKRLQVEVRGDENGV